MVFAHIAAEWLGRASTASADREPPPLVDPITAVVVVALVGLLATVVMLSRRRGIDMAQKHGWTPIPFTARDASGVITDQTSFLNGRRANATTGRWRQWTAERFQWFENDQPAAGSQTWIDCIRLPGALPYLAIRPIGRGRRQASAPILDHDALVGEFRKRWYVHDPGGWASDIVTEPFVRVMMAIDALPIPITISGSALFTHRRTWRRSDKNLEGRLDFLVRIAETIPRRTYEAVSANPAAATAAEAAAYPYIGERPLLAAQTGRNALALVSIALAATFLLAPIGLVFGVLAWKACDRRLASNRALAVTGVALNVAITALMAIMIIAF
jgi:hypothetical protein